MDEGEEVKLGVGISIVILPPRSSKNRAGKSRQQRENVSQRWVPRSLFSEERA